MPSLLWTCSKNVAPSEADVGSQVTFTDSTDTSFSVTYGAWDLGGQHTRQAFQMEFDLQDLYFKK